MGHRTDRWNTVCLRAYNHHYMAWMTGKHSHMEEVPVQGDHYGAGAHGKETEMRAVDNEDQTGRLFRDVAGAQQMFSEGNGGVQICNACNQSPPAID